MYIRNTKNTINIGEYNMANTTSFFELKKPRQSQITKLSEELSKVNSNKTSKPQNDDKFWQPTVDKVGNGYAVIRFLPTPKDESVPFIRLWQHGFKGPSGSWYIENSLSTIGKPDPLMELNTKLWNSGNDADKVQARLQKRKLYFISNIYVVKDPANPENEGKVFLFKYGKKIFDKISEAIRPPFDEEGRSPENPKYDPSCGFDPFDFWSGANFKLKIRQVEGYRNYDTSEFDKQLPLLDNDQELEKIWAQQHSLQQFLDPKHFQSYEVLKAKLDRVLGVTQENNVKFDQPSSEPKAQKKVNAPSMRSADDEDDDFDEIFKELQSN